MSHFRKCLALGAFLAFVIVASAQTVPSVSFATWRDFVVGESPAAIASGDFNGDGKVDLVTANTTSNDVSVLLSNGDGTFQPAVSYPAPNGGFLQVGDFNGDDKLDILVASYSTSSIAVSSVAVLLGNGDGTFQAEKITNIVNSNCRCLTAGDLNDDGRLDIIFPVTVPQLNNSAMAVMLANSDGTFQNATIANPGPFPTPFGVLTGDMNGDGNTDVVGIPNLNGIFVFLSDGDGTLRAPLQTDSGSGCWHGSANIADFNGDGNLDLECSTVEDSLAVYLGGGDGTFMPPINVNYEDSGPLIPGDFNGDGKLDLFDPVGTVLLGNGDGTFLAYPMTARGSRIAAVAGDFNGDGKVDVAATRELTQTPYTGLVSIIAGNGDGTLKVPISISNGQDFRVYIQGPILAADFNGDGKVDLIQTSWPYLTGPPPISTLLGEGNGLFEPFVSGSFDSAPAENCDNTSCFITYGDFNGDRKLDLAINVIVGNSLYGTNVMGVLLANEDGIFQPEVDYGNGNGGGGGIAVGDFNRDGNLDIVTAAPGSELSIFFGVGGGAFGFPTTIAANVGGQLAVADFNHDGILDIASGAGKVYILLGKGDGTFESAVSYSAGGVGSYLALADVNNDGNLDIVTGVGPVAVLLGNGDGTFGLPTTYSLAFTGSGVSVGDMNGDGNLDIAVLIPGLDVAVLAGNGDGTFQTPEYFGAMGSGGIASGDFFGDGTTDIAVANGPSVSLLLHKTVGAVASLSPNALTFGGQDVGSTSPAQKVTLTNSGTEFLTFTNIATTGDFAQTSTCSNRLAPGYSCAVTVTFTPAAPGARHGTLTITDNAVGNPQQIPLSGTGAGLELAVSGASSATIAAGQTATYNLSIGGGGFAGTATLTCSGAPTGATCSLPASVNVSATNASMFTVTVTTTARSSAAIVPNSFMHSGWLWAVAMMGIVILPSFSKKRRLSAARCLPIAFLLFIASCGGGGSSGGGGGGNGGGTPAGNYTVTVKATSGSLTQSLPLALTVQ